MDQQDQILQKMMADLGLSELPQDKQEELILKMTEVILKRMYVATMDRLSPSDQEVYGEMIERDAAPEELEEFLKSKISDYEQMLAKIADDFRSEMVASQNSSVEE